MDVGLTFTIKNWSFKTDARAYVFISSTLPFLSGLGAVKVSYYDSMTKAESIEEIVKTSAYPNLPTHTGWIDGLDTTRNIITLCEFNLCLLLHKLVTMYL